MVDLLTTHDVMMHIHNEFVGWLKKLDNTGRSWQGTADGWTADNTKASFLGVTAHWIDVKEGKWSLRSEVIGFKGVSGEHSGGANLGRGLCDRVGICNKERRNSDRSHRSQIR